MQVEQEYELVDVGRIQPHPQNPRRGVVEAIDQSIEQNGWYGVCTVQKTTGYILAGNHRYKAAVARGAKQVPVVWKDVDDQTAMRIMLADNKTADLGTYDEATLLEVLASLDTLDGTGYGLSVAEELDGAEEGPEEASGDVPDDQYTPQYGVMVVVDSEEAQAALYEHLQPLISEGQEPWAEGAQLRVVAV